MIWKKIITNYDKFLDKLMYTACVLLITAMLLTCIEVLTRYVLHKPIGWSKEVCEFILVAIVSLGMAWLLREDGHVKVDVLLNWFNPWIRDMLGGVTSAIGALAVLTITYYGLLETVKLAEMGARETGVLRYPKAYWIAPLVLGCLLFFIQLVRRSYNHFKKIRKNPALNSLTEGGPQHWNGNWRS